MRSVTNTWIDATLRWKHINDSKSVRRCGMTSINEYASLFGQICLWNVKIIRRTMCKNNKEKVPSKKPRAPRVPKGDPRDPRARPKGPPKSQRAPEGDPREPQKLPKGPPSKTKKAWNFEGPFFRHFFRIKPDFRGSPRTRKSQICVSNKSHRFFAFFSLFAILGTFWEKCVFQNFARPKRVTLEVPRVAQMCLSSYVSWNFTFFFCFFCVFPKYLFIKILKDC